MKNCVPLNARNCLISRASVRFSTKTVPSELITCSVHVTDEDPCSRPVKVDQRLKVTEYSTCR
jgi:hypothetical protein